ncbi:hypothetical protein J5N97_028373 [Dioscorea zingiberensis]|uniref:RNA polymerase II subunit A C-terminal domain phosphatase SSU72 n=1 Tax=Dioscorea zingiberensis TaxID=325984 RepID=A0A9D5BZ06_9LILI|nr:hypothetical protein J5N97_028373 [Dioscorea zingiberensis]
MRLRYVMVCSPNQNRSMEAHSLLKRQGLDAASYGTKAHDLDLYKRYWILPILKRNSSVKAALQSLQGNTVDRAFNVILAFEEKVFDMTLIKHVLIINLEVKDNHEEVVEESVDNIVIDFEKKHKYKLLYRIF